MREFPELCFADLIMWFSTDIPDFLAVRDEVAGEWRTLHNEELRDLYSSLSIIRIIKFRRMRWAGHVA
jgi:hypothetical protein